MHSAAIVFAAVARKNEARALCARMTHLSCGIGGESRAATTLALRINQFRGDRRNGHGRCMLPVVRINPIHRVWRLGNKARWAHACGYYERQGEEKMTDRIAAIEAALETEPNMMARQRLLKQRWKLNQGATNVENEPHSRPRDNGRPKQNECNAA